MRKIVFLKTRFVSFLALMLQFANAQSMNMDPRQMPPSENVFLSIMDTMMFNMNKTHPNIEPAAEFIEEMIPHHQGAIDMAKIEISKGRNFEMIQLAKSILVEQTNEIAQMQLLLNQMMRSDTAQNTDFKSAMKKTMEKMMDNMPVSSTLKETDKAFASVMIPHHQAAIDMARVVLSYSSNPLITAFAKQLISSEQVEIDQMNHFISN